MDTQKKPIAVTALVLALLVAILTVGAVAFYFGSDSSTTLRSTLSESQHIAGQEASIELEQPSSGEETPKEFVESIYDFGLEYRVVAIKAAEDMIQHYDRDSYLRWKAISIDPDSHLAGSYLKDGAMPKSIAVTPFPDVSIVADQTDYQVMEHIQSAIWTGSIRGTESGQVEISIVGGVGNPGFVIRFLNYPNLINIYPTEDVADVYIAVEGNPNQRYPDEH